MTGLPGLNVIITGAGTGIGQALAIGFVRKGASVHAIGRNAQGLAQTRAMASGTGSLATHECDVSDAAGVEHLFGEIVRQEGGVDLLVNNAAVFPRIPFAQFDAEAWRSGVSTNLDGVAYCCRAAIRTFPAGRRAVIINVGTFAHLAPEPGAALYCATKAGVSALTRAIAVDLRAAGSPLVVNEWVPGIYRTRMSADAGEDPGLAFDRLLAVWRASANGPGGRLFQRDHEVLPARSLRQRVLARLRLKRS